jgi:hypothetical protein
MEMRKTERRRRQIIKGEGREWRKHLRSRREIKRKCC